MPSTFTCFIEDGTIVNGREFVKLCTRYFGVETKISDNTNKVDILGNVNNESNGYFKRRLKEEQEILEKLKAMTPKEIEAEYKRIYSEEMETRKQAYDRAVELDAKYSKVLGDILKWQPDEKYENLRTFAINQIRESAPDMDSYREYLNLRKTDPMEWYAEVLRDTEDNIAKYIKRVERLEMEEKNYQEWYDGLKDALDKIGQ